MGIPEPRFGVVYDFRNPPNSGFDNASLYSETLRQVEWLESLGLDLVWFTEHHFVDDGYLPSCIPVASAMAARTERVRFCSNICLMPFQNALRWAEDLAVLDNLSNGRVEVGIGMGYAPHEFRAFGFPVSRRLSLTEEGIEILRRAFTGERFSFTGKRYQIDGARVTPGYVQEGGPPLWLAITAPQSAARAAEFRMNILPQGGRERTIDPYRKMCTAAGEDPMEQRVGIIRGCLPTLDPERDGAKIRSAERYRMQFYESLAQQAKRNIWEGEDVIPQGYIIGSADDCVARLVEFMQRYGVTDVVTWGLPPGMTFDEIAPSLESFSTEVVPRVRAELRTGLHALQ